MILTLIKTLTADGDSSLAFVDGNASVVLDSTYNEYMFVCTDIGPATDGAHFGFQVNAAGAADYNETITSTGFWAKQAENASGTGVSYYGGLDLTQETGLQNITYAQGNAADESSSGILHLFNPSSTTFVKHFISVCNVAEQGDVTKHCFRGGYFNTTSVIDAIQFKMSSDAIDAGTFKLYGIKDS